MGMAALARPRFGAAVKTRAQAPSAAEASTSAGLGGAKIGATGGHALGSAQLLARMQNRQQGVHQEAAAAGNESEALAQRITRDLVQYLQRHGGSARTADIVAQFRSVGEQHAALFRQLLKHLAILEKDADGSKRWALKPEFVSDT